MTGPARVRGAFARTAAEGRAAFIAYVLAGHRTLEESVAVAQAALDGGADLLEIGVPFSDPVADGPTIAEAGRAAVRHGAGLDSARQVVRELRAAGREQPLLLMSYRNPLRVAGDEALASLAADGVDGLIVPDLPAGEEPSFERAAAEARLALTFLVAPNTPLRRVEQVVRSSTGFVYVVPRYGVTGAGDSLAEGATLVVRRIRDAVAGRAPVAAGFGISRPEHVAELSRVADGVIVGSALVSTVREASAASAPRRARSLVRRLSAAARPG
ncbi:MAG: tryptophan synthase subunit alpha [Candidatus Limnocylindria bacterium]